MQNWTWKRASCLVLLSPLFAMTLIVFSPVILAALLFEGLNWAVTQAIGGEADEW